MKEESMNMFSLFDFMEVMKMQSKLTAMAWDALYANALKTGAFSDREKEFISIMKAESELMNQRTPEFTKYMHAGPLCDPQPNTAIEKNLSNMPVWSPKVD